jgi:hypothetical protein
MCASPLKASGFEGRFVWLIAQRISHASRSLSCTLAGRADFFPVTTTRMAFLAVQLAASVTHRAPDRLTSITCFAGHFLIELGVYIGIRVIRGRNCKNFPNLCV